MIRSTFFDTKVLTMVVQTFWSLAAFCTSMVTFSSPSLSFTASMKPWVAASSASWVTSWHTPMVYFLAPSASPVPSVLVSSVLLPQAAMLTHMTAASRAVVSRRVMFFFMVWFLLMGIFENLAAKKPPYRSAIHRAALMSVRLRGRTSSFHQQHFRASQITLTLSA